MGAIGVNYPTYLDVAKRTDPTGQIAAIVEIMSQYNPMIVEERTTSVPEELRNPTAHPDYMAITPTDREMALCFATSVDGHRWVKPELGLIEARLCIEGS